MTTSRDAISVIVEIDVPAPAEAEVWRRRQLASITRFLQAVNENRRRAGIVALRGNLHASHRPDNLEVGADEPNREVGRDGPGP